MKFFKKIIEFFKRAKAVTCQVDLKVQDFIKKHKKQIRLLITIFETMFPAETGAKKMGCLVTNVCYAIGLDAFSKDITDYVEKECQKVYDEFKSSLN